MKYKVDNVKNYKKTRGWICGQFFPRKSILKTSGLEVKYFTLNPGDISSKHYHPQGEELLVIINGKMRIKLDGKEFLLKKGDFVYQKSKVREEIIEVFKPTTFIAIRVPSVPNNKIEVI